MKENKSETVIDGNKVIYRRWIDVPATLLFEIWSEKEHLCEWWGPEGFTLSVESFTFQESGIWNFTMHGPDGHDYKNKIQFIKIDKPRFIHYKHLGDGEGDPDVAFEAKIFFNVDGEGTLLTMEQIFQSSEELKRVNEKYHAIEGAVQHIECLTKYANKCLYEGKLE